MCEDSPSKTDWPTFGGYVTSSEIFNRKNGKPNPYGILSTIIFGPTLSYRCDCGLLKNKTLDGGKTCPRCHVLCDDNSLRLKTFGKIKMVSPVIKSTKKNDIIKIIGRQHKQLLDPKQADANSALNRYVCINKEKTNIQIVSNINEAPTGYLPIPFRVGGIYSLIYVFRFLADIFKVEFIKNLFEENKIIDEIEVLPPDVRPIFKDPNKPNVLRYEEVNRFYISILNSNRRNQLFHPTMVEELTLWTKQLIEKIKNHDFTELSGANIIEYDQIAAFYQIYVDMVYDWAFDHIRGKKGLVRSTILSRTIEFSGRTVVSVDPDTKPYQLKVPREMLFTLWHPYFLNYLVKIKKMRYDECFVRVSGKKYYEIRKDPEIYANFLEFLRWFNESEEAKTIDY